MTGKSEIIKTDRAGHITKSFNNLFDKPYRIKNPDGTVETINYSTKGEMISNTDRAGFTASFVYDRAGNRISSQQFIRTDGTMAVGFLVGQVMKETKGKANPGLVNKLIIEKLNG